MKKPRATESCHFSCTLLHCIGVFVLLTQLPVVLTGNQQSTPRFVIDAQDEAKAIVDKSISAYGGMVKLKRWSCGFVKYQSTGDGVQFPGGVMMEDTFQFPGHFKRIASYQINGVKSQSIYVIDKDQGWSKLNNQETRPEDAEYAKRVEHMIGGFYNMLHVLEGNYKLSRLADEKLGHEDVAVIHVENGGGVQVEFYINKKSGMLLKTVKTVQLPEAGKKTVSIVKLEDYKDVQGGPVPMTFKCYHDGKLVMIMKIDELRFVEKHPAGTFSKP